METNVRFVPFTDEEKAKLNEKVRKMKFSRPPPKLPSVKTTAAITPTPQKVPQLRLSMDCEKNDKNSSIDDSGISSCGSENCETPVNYNSLTKLMEQSFEVACDKYVCDGDDWVQEDSSDELKNDLNIDIGTDVMQEDYIKPSTSVDLNSFQSDDLRLGEIGKIEDDIKSTELKIGTDSSLTVDVTSSSPVEKIDATSPVVFSERLQATLSRKRAELVELSPRPDLPIGKFEEPQYGRSLLSTTFPTASLQNIMESTLGNLAGYRILGRPMICQARGKPPPDPSMIAEIETELNKECVEIRKPAPTVLKRKHGKKRKKEPEDGETAVMPKDGKQTDAPLVTVLPGKEMRGKDDARAVDEPPIKIIFRKDANRKISGVRVEIPDVAPTTAVVMKKPEPSHSSPQHRPAQKSSANPVSSVAEMKVVSRQHNECGTGLKIRIKLQPPKPLSSSEKSPIKQEPAASVENEKLPTKKCSNPINVAPVRAAVDADAESDDDIIIVHESIRKPSDPVKPPLWARLNVVEESFLAKLASLLKIGEVDISRPTWFEEVCGEVEKSVYHLEFNISALKGTKMKLKKRLEQLQLTSHHLKVLLAKKQNKSLDSSDSSYRLRKGAKQKWQHCIVPPTPSAVHCQRSNSLDCEFGIEERASQCAAFTDFYRRKGPGTITLPPIAPVHMLPPRLQSHQSLRRSQRKLVIRMRSPPEVVPKDPVPSSSQDASLSQKGSGGSGTVLQAEKEARKGESLNCTIANKLSSPEDLKVFHIDALKSLATMNSRSQDMTETSPYSSDFVTSKYFYKNGVSFERRYERLQGSHVMGFTHHKVDVPF